MVKIKFMFVTTIGLITTLLFTSPLTRANSYYVGEITMSDISSKLSGFDENVSDMNWNQTQLDTIQSFGNKLQFKIFFAEWCHDSKKEVPKIINLLQELKLTSEQTWFYSLDTQKSDPKQFAKQHQITNTPTLILLIDNKEVGRIKEYPTTNWLNDIIEILKLY